MIRRSTPAAVLFILLLAESAFGQCPSGAVGTPQAGAVTCFPGFGGGLFCSQTISWPALSGAASYEVRLNPAASYCEGLGAQTVAGTTSGTTFTLTGLPADSVHAVFVVALGADGTSCGTTASTRIRRDTFQARPPKPVLSATVSGSVVSLAVTQAASSTQAIGGFERADASGSFLPVMGFSAATANYCPPGTVLRLDDPGLASGLYRYRAFNTGNAASGFTRVYSDEVTALVGCPTPGKPVLSSPNVTVEAGTSFAASWTAASDLLSGGSYVLEASRSSSFATIETALTTDGLSSVLPLPVEASGYTFYVRVRALQPCGASSASDPVTLTVTLPPAVFLFTRGAPDFTTTKGVVPEERRIAVKNIGGSGGTLTLTSLGGLVSLDRVSVDLVPQAEAEIVVTVSASAVATPGFRSGAIVGSIGSRSITTPVTLTVTEQPAEHRGTKAAADRQRVEFLAPTGANPAAEDLTITLSPLTGSGPLLIQPTVGPGGSWLILEPTELSSPLAVIDGSASRRLTLRVDRSRRQPEDGASPVRTLLKVKALGSAPDDSDAVVVEVVDTDQVPVTTNAGAGRPTQGSSFIVPSAVSASGQGSSRFVSDGWVRNVGSTDHDIDLYFTPRDADGLSDAGVRKATTRVPAGNTLRLSNVVSSTLGTTGSGLMEIRSETPSALTVRTAVEATTGGDATARFSGGIPTIANGSGVAAGEPVGMILPAVFDDPTRSRFNVQLAETTGRAVRVEIVVYDESGRPYGDPIQRDVPPLGMTQIDSLAGAARPEGSLAGGYAIARGIGGEGRAFAMGTLVDRRNNSYAVVGGKAVPLPTTGASRPAGPAEGAFGTAGTSSSGVRAGHESGVLRRRRSALAEPLSIVVPAIVRTTGAASTDFRTRMQIQNISSFAANVTLTYHYVDLDDGGASKDHSVVLTLPPRGVSGSVRNWNDVTTEALGFPSARRTYGWLELSGDLEKVGPPTTLILAFDGPEDTVGKYTFVNAIGTDDRTLLFGPHEQERRLAGVESTVQKRTNFHVVEITGNPCDVTLRAFAKSGQRLAEKTYSIPARAYFQVNEVLVRKNENALAIGDGPLTDVELAAQVVSGSCRVLAFATINDNISRQPAFHTLTLPGPAQGGGPRI